MIRPGARNLITDVDGILVGNADDASLRSGVTVVLPEHPAVGAVDVRGGGPGTRETEVLRPTSSTPTVDAICLSGGSAFGLDAASGVVRWLASAGRGFAVGQFRVPIVPAAILFDLANGGDKDWSEASPYPALGHRAATLAARDFALGNAGAGYGAAAGRVKGGLGSASAVSATGLQVGALVAANPVGSVLVPGTDRFWAAHLEQEAEFGGRGPATMAGIDLDLPADGRLGGHTCIGVVAVNAKLDKADAQRVAMMAHDGLARAIRPVHTPMDGDTIFVLATGAWPLAEPRLADLALIGSLAADCVARAVARAVYAAESLGSMPSYRSLYGN